MTHLEVGHPVCHLCIHVLSDICKAMHLLRYLASNSEIVPVFKSQSAVIYALVLLHLGYILTVLAARLAQVLGEGAVGSGLRPMPSDYVSANDYAAPTSDSIVVVADDFDFFCFSSNLSP